MRKLIIILTVTFIGAVSELSSQSINYRAFYFQISKHYCDFTPLWNDIDTMNAHGASYKHPFGHFTYGMGFVRKKKFIETGGHIYSGNTKEMFSGTSD